jgi:hypothetical protein
MTYQVQPARLQQCHRKRPSRPRQPRRKPSRRLLSAPFEPPTPTSGVGAQFASSQTGIPYPPLNTLYPGQDGPTVDDVSKVPTRVGRAIIYNIGPSAPALPPRPIA